MLVESFPKDDVLRTVFAVGSLVNTDSYKSNPLVNVLLAPAFYKDRNIHKSILVQIPISELDVVRVGTFWQGRKKDTIKLASEIEEREFFEFQSFSKKIETDFEITEIPRKSKMLKFGSKDENGNYLIPLSRFDLPKSVEKNQNCSSRMNVQNSFCNVFEVDGIEYVIPCLELFTSLYAPMRKELRRMILTHTKQEIIEKFVDEAFTKIENNKITLKLKSNLSDSSAVFLAHLLVSPHTNDVFEQIRNDVYKNQVNNDGFLNLRIENYFVGQTKIKGKGLWLNDEKTRLLVLRINFFQLPNDLQVNLLETRKIQQSKEPSQTHDEIDVNRTVIEKNRLNLTTKTLNLVNRRPNTKGTRKNHVLSEIQTSVLDDALIREVKLDYTNSDHEIDENDEYGYAKEEIKIHAIDKEEMINVSSGDKYIHQGDPVWQNEIKRQYLLLEPHKVPIEVFDALIQLKGQDDSFIKSITNIDHIESDDLNDFKISYVDYPFIEKNNWVLNKHNQYREIIILKLNFIPEKFKDFDTSKNYYLVEILRHKAAGNSNTGYVLKTSYELNENGSSTFKARQNNKLIHLLEALTQNSGKLEEKTSYDWDIKAFKHGKGGHTWESKMESVLFKKFKLVLV